MPLYDSDLAEKKKLKLGEIYEMDAKEWKPRNLQFHKKFFALVNLGCENSQRDMPFKAYRAYVTMKAGYAETYKTEVGVMALPKSISFKNMGEDEFAQVYSAVLNVIIKDIGATREDIEDNLINFF